MKYCAIHAFVSLIPQIIGPQCPSPLPCKQRLQVTSLKHCNDVAVEYEVKGRVPLWDDPDQD